ncbi:MAG: hypothetical protein AB1Z98_40450 [Nannocystaceae bacterium]
MRTALDPELEGQGGAYFDRLERAKLAPVAEDRTLAQEVWSMTESLVAGARHRVAHAEARAR